MASFRIKQYNHTGGGKSYQLQFYMWFGWHDCGALPNHPTSFSKLEDAEKLMKQRRDSEVGSVKYHY